MVLRKLVGLFAVIGVLSAPTAMADGARYYDYIYKIQVSSDGFLYVNVVGNFAGEHNCPNLAYARSEWPLSDERTKAMLQLATASYLSRTRVYVATTGCANNTTANGYPKMTSLQLEQ